MMAKNKIGESELVWRYFGCRTSGVFVDVGANHPTINNQSWFLEKRGWTGVVIEPNPAHYKLLREQRPKSQVFQTAVGAPNGPQDVTLHLAGPGLARHSKVHLSAHGSISTNAVRVKMTTLDYILEQSGISKIDFLSIDVEGMEFDVLAGFTFEKYRPELFCIEDFCRDFAKKRYMRGVGYKLVRRVGYNNWYVPREAPASAFSISTGRQFLRLIRKDLLSVPFAKARRGLRASRDPHRRVIN